MYHDYFGLRDAPFSIAPDPRYLYLTEQHREALAHLLFGVSDQGGFVVLTGEVGTGKTTVCRSLLQQMPDNADYAFVVNPRQTVPELLQTICSELHIATDSDFSTKEYVDLLNEFLLENHARGRNTIVIIDEAQNLSVDVLEQLRLLTNLETNERKLLQLILLGQPELNELLASHALRQLSQRVTARYHLRPLSLAETEPYILHRLQVAGCDLPLFTRAAIRAIYRASGGIPRLINLISDRALLGVYAHNLPEVNHAVVAKARREVLGEMGAPKRHKRWIGIGIAASALVLVCAAGLYWYGPRVSAFSAQGLATPGAPSVQQVMTPSPEASAPSPATPFARAVVQRGEVQRAGWDFAQAFAALAARWQLAADPLPGAPGCPPVRTDTLRCIAVDSWEAARIYNVPAVVQLADGEFALVLGGEAGVVQLLTADGERELADQALATRPAWLLRREVFSEGYGQALSRHSDLVQAALGGEALRYKAELVATQTPARSDKASLLYQHFVYFSPQAAEVPGRAALQEQLLQFQKEQGLPATGKVDLATAVRIGQRLHRDDPVLRTGQGG